MGLFNRIVQGAQERIEDAQTNLMQAQARINERVSAQQQTYRQQAHQQPQQASIHQQSYQTRGSHHAPQPQAQWQAYQPAQVVQQPYQPQVVQQIQQPQIPQQVNYPQTRTGFPTHSPFSSPLDAGSVDTSLNGNPLKAGIDQTPISETVFCLRCGCALSPTAKFCPECGVPTTRLSQVRPPIEYAFLDVETPNRRNDRICSMGIIRTNEQGEIIGWKYSLVDPDVEFDPFNVSIHGITEFDVHGAPSFRMAWQEFFPLLQGATLVAHNARFDLTVLDKTLAANGIQHGPVCYICTMSMASARHPEFGRFKLDSVCRACNIPLKNHHNALSDAEACMRVFFALGGHEEPLEYTPLSDRVPRQRVFSVPRSDASKSHNELMMHAMDILRDGRVDLNEAIGLRWWLEKNANLTDSSAVTELLALLSNVLEDGRIDREEESQLLSALNRLVNPATDNARDGIDGKKFCLTGDFAYGSKDEVASRLEAFGAVRSNNVTKTCDYVIVGACGSAAYAHGSYGSKVKTAMEWQSKGVPMKIVREENCPWLQRW